MKQQLSVSWKSVTPALSMSSERNINYIDNKEALISLAGVLESQPWIALDTEFLRERTYRPELCLLQIAAGDTLACVDPLALDNIDPLLDVIYNPSITKVLHAAGQDLEIFYWLRGSIPENLFDTQIAAPLLGYQEQIGYANLVKEVLAVELSKSHSRADWTRRPLPPQQLNYAADDVIYLAKMYPAMRDELKELNRLEWLDQEWIDLTNPHLYEKPVEEMWKKLRQIDKLKGPRLAIAQQLAAWRELTARERNLPRNWLLKDDVLIDLAKQMPVDESELKHIRGLSDGLRRQHGSAITALIKKARDTKPEKFIIPPRKSKLTSNQDASLDVLSAVVKTHATRLRINPSILAPRKSLEELITGKRDTAIMQGWRRQLIGQALCSVLDGERQLHFVEGKLAITE